MVINLNLLHFPQNNLSFSQNFNKETEKGTPEITNQITRSDIDIDTLTSVVHVFSS
jgi:hypothetical protein